MSAPVLSRPEPRSGATDAPLVEIEGLGRVFDLSRRWLNRVLEGSGKVMLTAVDGVDMSIRRGETYALVGESGSGKSTIAKMVVGLLPPTTGTVRIDGADIWKELGGARQRQIRRKIQMIFQDPFASLNPRWRVGAIVEEPIKAFGMIADARERDHRVGELLRLVGLDPRDAGSSRMNSPAGNASASPSRGRFPPARSSSSATSRPRRWTCPCRRRS